VVDGTLADVRGLVLVLLVSSLSPSAAAVVCGLTCSHSPSATNPLEPATCHGTQPAPAGTAVKGAPALCHSPGEAIAATVIAPMQAQAAPRGPGAATALYLPLLHSSSTGTPLATFSPPGRHVRTLLRI
jgi:hypothetical protein